MTSHSRVLAAVIIAGAAMTGLVLAQGAGAPAPQTPPPAGQQPAQPAGGGRGGGDGQAPQGRGQAPGGRRGGFPQYTRVLPTQDVILRGKGLYDTNCASCHAPDLRGTPPNGTNLIRSGDAFRDQNGEVIGPAIARHKPAINFLEPDVVAVSAYIHSIQASMGGQGSPPGRGATNTQLNILVGDAKAGEAKFGTFCSKCHSVTGDLASASTKYGDVRALQNAWVAGVGGRFGGGGRGAGGGTGNPATVTLANGTKLEGALVRQDDFIVVLLMPDGTRRSMARVNGMPKVEVKDPQEAHKKMVLEIDDANNQNMYDITAYLATIK